MIRKASAMISTLFACGIVGGLYGVLLGALDAWLVTPHLGSRITDVQGVMEFLAAAICWGALLGFPAGFISGVLGACLGGPIGYSLGGFAGTGAVMFYCFGSVVGLRAIGVPLADEPAIWGAIFGLLFGLHVKRRMRVLPGLGWLADGIYRSPLGGWVGWRHHAEG